MGADMGANAGVGASELSKFAWAGAAAGFEGPIRPLRSASGSNDVRGAGSSHISEAPALDNK